MQQELHSCHCGMPSHRESQGPACSPERLRSRGGQGAAFSLTQADLSPGNAPYKHAAALTMVTMQVQGWDSSKATVRGGITWRELDTEGGMPVTARCLGRTALRQIKHGGIEQP